MTEPVRQRPHAQWLVLAVAVLATVLGALRLEILVDDAFIGFRHVANARDGHGLVWNPPPFLPVCGYTSLGWELLLWATWAWFGVEPPVAANFLSIGCGLVLVVFCARTLWSMRDRRGEPLGAIVVACTLACLVGNRTFLQWLTGGLDTALFAVLVVPWVVVAFRPAARRGVGWISCWATLAATAAVARPDGLLLVAATVAAVGCGVVRREWRVRTAAIGLLPLTVVVVHFLWHRSFFGDWLPNTYYAKVGNAWPEAGVRYLLCFALDNGVWLWALLALTWLASELRRAREAFAALRANLPGLLAVGAIAVHLAYYVVRVGGDHFEYRVLNHLVPLGALSAAAMTTRLGVTARGATAILSSLALAASVAWYQLAVTEFRIPPSYDALSAHTPGWARPLARFYDRHRLWLQTHMVGIRFLHGFDLATATALFPERKRRAGPEDDFPVMRATAVGWVGWVLPDVAIIDELGLNDWVAARTPMGSPGDKVFPPAVRKAMLDDADPDHDGIVTRTELAAAYGKVTGASPNDATAWTDAMMMLFAREHDDRLTANEAAGIDTFYAEMRLMAHDRWAPADYVAAFDPNVTLAGREVQIRKRSKPLRAVDIVAIEAEWRQRVRQRTK